MRGTGTRFFCAALAVSIGASASAQVIFIDDFSTPNPGGVDKDFGVSTPGYTSPADGIGAARTVGFSFGTTEAIDPLGSYEISNGAFVGTASVGGRVFVNYAKEPIDSLFRYAPSGDYSGQYIKVELGAGSQAGVLAFTQSTSHRFYINGSNRSDPTPGSRRSVYYNVPAVDEDTTILLGLEQAYGGSRTFLPIGEFLPEWKDTTHIEGENPSQTEIGVRIFTNTFNFSPGIRYDGLGPTGGFQGGPGPQFSILDPQLTSGTVVINSISLDPVPEPGTMIAFGAAGALFLRRRKKAQIEGSKPTGEQD